jgi:D-glycero-alpha-D-manno-heptose-7-phosphate kinase
VIISKAPTRITFAGGATDAKPYYIKRGGFLVAAGIDKYIWMIAQKPFQGTIKLKYKQNEEITAGHINEIEHPLFRETLRFCNLSEPIELTCLSDIPSNCGLGTSGAFTISLLDALTRYTNHALNKETLAEIASHIEIDILGNPIGRQDQYMSAFGGLTCLLFNPDGMVEVEKLRIKNEDAHKLNKSLMLFDTNIRRSTDGIQSQQYDDMKRGGVIFNHLDEIKEMALETRRLLERGLLNEWGNLLNSYWQVRKKMSDKITLPLIDEAYDLALKNGALGGKVIGAGGGGFLMLYCPKNKYKLTDALAKLKLKPMPFSWDFEGVKSYNL